MSSILIKLSKNGDIPWIQSVFKDSWDGDFVVTRGKKYYPEDLYGLIAYLENKRVGLLTYREHEDSIEIISLDSFKEKKGVGTSLIQALIYQAKKKGIKRIWLITTNNNTHAMQFYEHRGFKNVHVYKDAVVELRKLKPSIPLVDEFGVPINDEVEYEYRLMDNSFS